MSHHNHQVGRCDWRTPPEVLERVRFVFGDQIGLDPATAPDNPTEAKVFFTERGLEQSWNPHRDIFMNPPWSKKESLYAWHWAAAMWLHNDENPSKQMIEVLPASVNAKWFHKWVMPSSAICFPEGRIAYVPPPGELTTDSPTFDSCIAYFGPAPLHFKGCFEDFGEVLRRV